MMCGKDVAIEVMQGGMYNWATFNPQQPKDMILVKAGRGSLPEMTEFLRQQSEHAVVFGVARVGFGTGHMKRYKLILMTSALEDGPMGSIGALQMGKLMGNQKDFVDAIKSAMTVTVTHISFKSVDDITLEAILENLSKKFIVDHSDLPEAQSDFTKEAFMQAMEEDGIAGAEDAKSEPDDVLEELVDDHGGDAELEAQIVSAMSKFSAVGQAVQGSLQLAETAEKPAEAPAAEVPVVPAMDEVKTSWQYNQAIVLKRVANAESFEEFLRKKCLLLDKDKYSTIIQAVDGINGLDEAAKYVDQDGYCVIWSAIKTRHVLLFKEGPEADPYKYKFEGLKFMMMGMQGVSEQVATSTVQSIKAGMPEIPAPFRGNVMKQASNLISEWQCRTFELNRGVFSYWHDARDIEKSKPRGQYSLLGAKASSSSLSEQRFQVKLIVQGKEKSYNFISKMFHVAGVPDKSLERTRDQWLQNLNEHIQYAVNEAAYKRACAILVDDSSADI